MNTNDSEFIDIFRTYYAQAIFYATRLVGNDEAEDVVQDSFIELWKRDYILEDPNHIKSFLFRAVYTHSLNILKHRLIQDSYSKAMSDIELMRAQFYQPEDNETIRMIEDKELREEIFTAINELPEKRRMAFVMSYLHGMKNEEIASLMNVSTKTVEAHIYKALIYLRSRLNKLIALSILFGFLNR